MNIFKWVFSKKYKLSYSCSHCSNDNKNYKKFRKVLNRNGNVFPYSTIIGKNVIINHPFGIVLGTKTVIGDNCKIGHNVTIGQNKGFFPKIGNNVTISPNCVIIGKVSIGDDCLIEPCSLVVKDFSSGCIICGNPAIKKEL